LKHPAQEPDVVPGKTIAGVILGVIGSIVVGVLVMVGIQNCRTNAIHGDPRAAAEGMDVPEQVNALDTEPFVLGAHGIEANTLDERVLESYSWVDRQQEIVRVPITVAFDLYLARRPAPVAGREP
jgi:CDP-diglyceride synthetase